MNNKNEQGLGYCNRAKNKDPRFIVPDSHEKQGRLAFIREVVDKSQRVDVLASDVALWARANGDRQRAYHLDRKRAIRALCSAFAEHVNVVTHQVKISLRMAAEHCGLHTVSQREQDRAKQDPLYTPKVNYSRASRAFKDMIELGWIIAPKAWQVWDKHAGYWLDKVFEVTPLFFKALGITPERVERVRSSRLAYLKNRRYLNLSADQLGEMTISEIKDIERHNQIRANFERRKASQALKKLKRQLHGKDAAGQRQVAVARVIENGGNRFNDDEFSRQVNMELASIRRMCDVAATSSA
jgi:hypothetical protein